MALSILDGGGRAPRPDRRARRRRAVAGLLAVAASLSAHALLAAVAGVSLFVLGGRAEPPGPAVEVAVAVDITAAPPAPPSPISRAPPVDVPPRALPRRRAVATAPLVAAAPPPSPVPALAPPPTGDPSAPPVLFVMSAGTVAGRGAAVPVGAAAPPTPGRSDSPSSTSTAAAGDPPLAADAVDVPARLLAGRPAIYPAGARRAEVESDVPLEIVVAPAGAVVSARVVVPRGYGLDGAALEAVRSYRFSPARRAGRAVPVRMRWTVQFRLR
jgi:protein TonB